MTHWLFVVVSGALLFISRCYFICKRRMQYVETLCSCFWPGISNHVSDFHEIWCRSSLENAIEHAWVCESQLWSLYLSSGNKLICTHSFLFSCPLWVNSVRKICAYYRWGNLRKLVQWKLFRGVSEFLYIISMFIVQWVKFCVRDLHITLYHCFMKIDIGKAILFTWINEITFSCAPWNCMTFRQWRSPY